MSNEKAGIFIKNSTLFVVIKEQNRYVQLSTGLKVGNPTPEEKRSMFRFVIKIFYEQKTYNLQAFKSELKAKLTQHIIKSFAK